VLSDSGGKSGAASVEPPANSDDAYP
jgi:hypothetical protein